MSENKKKATKAAKKPVKQKQKKQLVLKEQLGGLHSSIIDINMFINRLAEVQKEISGEEVKLEELNIVEPVSAQHALAQIADNTNKNILNFKRVLEVLCFHISG